METGNNTKQSTMSRSVISGYREPDSSSSWIRSPSSVLALIVIAFCNVSDSMQQLIVRGSGSNLANQQQQQHLSPHPNLHHMMFKSSQSPVTVSQSFNSVPNRLQRQEHLYNSTPRSQLQATNSININSNSNSNSNSNNNNNNMADFGSKQFQAANEDLTEARGPFLRNSLHSQLATRGARNASSNGSWHFPRFSTEHAAEILIQGAQVINRIAQAETNLNYCKTPDNQEGECSDIRKCIWLVLDKARLKQSVCLRNLVIPAVCCPLTPANMTPIANMLQSTLEPVLFRPKQPKQKKSQFQMASHLRPLSSIMNKTIIGSPPPGPVSLLIRNQPTFANSTNGTVVGNIGQASHSTLNNNYQGPQLGDHLKPVDLASINAPADQVFSWISSSTTSQPTSALSASDKDQAPATTNKIQSNVVHSSVVSSTTPFSLFPSGAGEDLSLSGSNKLAGQNSHSAGYNRTLGQKYPWWNETCGESGRTRTGRIVGGTDSKLGQWPWMTAMYLNKRTPFIQGAGEFWCGGALISRRFILTAAHCLSDQRGNRYRNDQVTIKLGGIDLVKHQAPADILRNAELVDSPAPAPPSVGSQLLTFRDSLNGLRRRNSKDSSERHFNKDSGRNDSDDAEFSWTSFITKALGLISGAVGSSSGNPEGPSKSLAVLNPDDVDLKKQQLAAHAKKTYFKEYKVASIKQHPKFQRHGFYNDIGLIELKSDVDYDDLISPICLPNEFDLKRDLSGYMATVLGWGTLSYGGQGSKMLQQVSMPVWDNKDCDERYLQHIGKTFLCAGFLTGGKDACQGDSGGPLMVSDKTGRWTLHGVVSFGKTCAQAGYPGVYTRVTEYLDWIRDNTESGGFV